MIFINFKTYEQGTGPKAVELIRIISEVQKSTSISLIPVVQVADAYMCARESNTDVWVQHVDSVEYGKHTGWVLPEAVAATGVKGTLLNHSEHKLDLSLIPSYLSLCRKANLKTLVFASNLEELSQLTRIDPVRPDFVSFEPPELIASKETSVAKSKSQDIKKAVEIASSIPLIVGAGIKDAEDIKVSLALGSKGVVVSSAIVLSDDPKVKIIELTKAFHSHDS